MPNTNKMGRQELQADVELLQEHAKLKCAQDGAEKNPRYAENAIQKEKRQCTYCVNVRY